MTDTCSGVLGEAKTILGGAVAGFAFGQAASFAVSPPLTEDGAMLHAAVFTAGQVGSTGVGVVTACLLFTSVLVSLGSGFLVATVAMKLLLRLGAGNLWFAGAATGASLTFAAVPTGILTGILPPWIYFATQGVLVLIVYSYSNINDMTTALLIIFTTLYLSVLYGRMGLLVGLFLMGVTISVLVALRRTLTKTTSRRSTSKTGCKLLERIFFYSVVVGILGFLVGVGAGGAGDGSEQELVWMLQSVLWVTFLSAGLLGAGLGTVVVVGLGPELDGKFAMGVAVVASAASAATLWWSPGLGLRSTMGGALAAATAAGVSLGAVGVASKRAFQSRNSTLAALGSVGVGAVLGAQGLALGTTIPARADVVMALVAAGAFVLGAPKSPFNTQVNLRRGLLTGAELIKDIGMETITAAAAPVGAGALGAAALGTASLGKVGTVGVLVTVMLALGSTLSGLIGKSPSTDEDKDE